MRISLPIALLLSGADGSSVERTAMLQSVAAKRAQLGTNSTEEQVSKRKNRLASLDKASKDLAKSYSSLLEKVVKSPNNLNQIPKDDVLTPLKDSLTALKQELVDEQLVNQNLFDAANAAVAQCNTNRQNSFTAPNTGVDALATKTGNGRSTHTTCRTDQDDLLDVRDSACSVFNHAVSQLQKAQYSQPEWWDKNGDGTNAVGSLLWTQAKAKLCYDSRNAADAKDPICDSAQDGFNNAFCAWAQELTSVCGQLDKCHTDTNAARASTETDIQTLEASQKLVYKTVEQIECFIDKLVLARTQTLQQTHYDECANLVSDTTSLNIVYAAADPKDSCDITPVNDQPGDPAWEQTEYGHAPFNVGHIPGLMNPVQPCATKQTR